MKTFALDPATLPAVDIIALAQSGVLLRAERQTPENGVPAFVTREDWALIQSRFSEKNEALDSLLISLERAVHRLLGHAAETLATREPGIVSATLNTQTDLFDDQSETYLSFVRDQTHPVACVIIGSHPWVPPLPTEGE